MSAETNPWALNNEEKKASTEDKKPFYFIKNNKSLIVCLTPHHSDEVRVPETDCHELLLRDVALVIDVNLAEQNLRFPYTFLFGQILNLKIRLIGIFH